MKKVLVCLVVCMIALVGVLGVANAATFYNKEVEAVKDIPNAVRIDPKTGDKIVFLPSVAVIPILTDMQQLPKGAYDDIMATIDRRLDYQVAMPFPQEKVMEAIKATSFEADVTANGLNTELLEQIRQKLGVDVVMAVYIKDVREDFIVSSISEVLVVNYEMELMAVYSWKEPVKSKLNNKVDTEYVFVANTNWAAKQLSMAVDRFMDKVLNFKK